MKLSVEQILRNAEQAAHKRFAEIDRIALHNQEKVLDAFRRNRIADRHLKGTTGYGYDDLGREAIAKVYADVFGAQKAIVSPLITGGTHALVLALFGLLLPGDTLLSVSGAPYDTLYNAIVGEGEGSMKEYGIKYDQIDLLGDRFDYPTLIEYLSQNKPKVVFVTRSRGYSFRNALTVEEIGELARFVKERSPGSIVFVDNCYGEFCEEKEPTEVGADICVGSLIKNIGGGLAPTGGYIVGREDLVTRIGYRFIAPGLGTEVGSYEKGYRDMFQGLFLAPSVVANAQKGSALFAFAFSSLGYVTVPGPDEVCSDIIRSIVFNDPDSLIAFIQSVQRVSPIDSDVVPEPWDMPGYQDQVIMAAGTFVAGASIELSADAPIKPPYIAYLQGGLTYQHAYIACKYCLKAVLKEEDNQ